VCACVRRRIKPLFPLREPSIHLLFRTVVVAVYLERYVFREHQQQKQHQQQQRKKTEITTRARTPREEQRIVERKILEKKKKKKNRHFIQHSTSININSTTVSRAMILYPVSFQYFVGGRTRMYYYIGVLVCEPLKDPFLLAVLLSVLLIHLQPQCCCVCAAVLFTCFTMYTKSIRVQQSCCLYNCKLSYNSCQFCLRAGDN